MHVNLVKSISDGTVTKSKEYLRTPSWHASASTNDEVAVRKCYSGPDRKISAWLNFQVRSVRWWSGRNCRQNERNVVYAYLCLAHDPWRHVFFFSSLSVRGVTYFIVYTCCIRPYTNARLYIWRIFRNKIRLGVAATWFGVDGSEGENGNGTQLSTHMQLTMYSTYVHS